MKIPKGWYRLAVRTIVKEGDKFAFGEHWVPCKTFVGSSVDLTITYIRRKPKQRSGKVVGMSQRGRGKK